MRTHRVEERVLSHRDDVWILRRIVPSSFIIHHFIGEVRVLLHPALWARFPSPAIPSVTGFHTFSEVAVVRDGSANLPRIVRCEFYAVLWAFLASFLFNAPRANSRSKALLKIVVIHVLPFSIRRIFVPIRVRRIECAHSTHECALPGAPPGLTLGARRRAMGAATHATLHHCRRARRTVKVVLGCAFCNQTNLLLVFRPEEHEHSGPLFRVGDAPFNRECLARVQLHVRRESFFCRACQVRCRFDLRARCWLLEPVVGLRRGKERRNAPQQAERERSPTVLASA